MTSISTIILGQVSPRFKKLREQFGFGLVIKFIVSNYTLLMVSSFLQFFNHVEDDEKVNAFSHGVAVIIICLYVLLIVVTITVHCKIIGNPTRASELITKYKCLFEGSIFPNPNGTERTKPFLSVLLLKGLLGSLILVVCNRLPTLQVVLLALLDIVCYNLLYQFKPYVRHSVMWKNYITEFLFFCSHCLLIIVPSRFDSLPEESNKKLVIGWVVIAFCAAILIVNMYYDLVGLFSKFYQVLSPLFKEKQYSKISTKTNTKTSPLASRRIVLNLTITKNKSLSAPPRRTHIQKINENLRKRPEFKS